MAGAAPGGALHDAICSRAIAPLLFGVTAWDVVSLTAAMGGVLLVAGTAALLPAMHAAAIQPSEALREE